MNILNKEEIEIQKQCGRFLAESLDEVKNAVKVGISTLELDKVAERELIARGCRPSFKNYYVPGCGSFPASLCVSINNEVVHGIPKEGRLLRDGDIVSLDLGAEYKGIYTDMCITVPVGAIADNLKTLLLDTNQALTLGIKEAKAGNRIGDIGYAIQKFAEARGYGVVRDLVGHGIGRLPHTDPQVPNYGERNTGPKIVEGMSLAIEPMLTLGDYNTTTAPDGWTIKTLDGSMVAQFEHTITIIDGQAIIMTKK